MSLFNKPLLIAAFSVLNLSYCTSIISANIYVDKTLSSSCTAGSYSIAKRSCDGSDGSAYNTIQKAIDNMNTGDDIFIRGGTYLENVLLNGNTPDGTADDYASLQSYLGEWAVIDGQNRKDYTVGKSASGRDVGNDLHYWKFERLEITGGTNGRDGGAGLYISGGPFIVRYNYIHDNLASTGDENPGGIVGYTWRDSIIEYNYFDNNGTPGSSDGNSANIAIFSDYLWQKTGRDGFKDNKPSIRGNEIKYNYFSGSSIGFKHKGAQLFTGRNPGTSDYNDAHQDRGDKIHHNYFTGQRGISLIIGQDFAQVYNNIFDSVPEAIAIDYEPDMQLYKVVTYNNLIWNPGYKGIIRYGCVYFPFTENESHYGWDYNNIIDSSTRVDNNWFMGTAINIFNGCNGRRKPFSNPDISNYFNSYNYFYRPDDAEIFNYGTPNVFLNAAEFEKQTDTGVPRVAYTNPYDADNLLYAGTTGANKFITSETHLIKDETTIANGGIGGAHPYLSGITIPSYVGAVDPNDNGWVAGILCLKDIETLMNGNTEGPVCSITNR